MRFIDAPFYVRQMIVVSFILTFVLAIIGLFASVRLCKKRRYIVLTAVTFALSFLSVFLTMCGSYLYRVGKSVFEPSLTIISLPLWLHCIAAVADSLLRFTDLSARCFGTKSIFRPCP